MNLTKYVLSCIMLFALGCNNPCRELDCANEGFCYEGSCLCQKWYSGDECELSFNRNYEGTYYGTFAIDELSISRNIDSVKTEASTLIPNRLFLDLGFFVEFDSDSTISIPLQTVQMDTIEFDVEGSGVFEFNVLTLEYTKDYKQTQLSIESVSFSGQRISNE